MSNSLSQRPDADFCCITAEDIMFVCQRLYTEYSSIATVFTKVCSD